MELALTGDAVDAVTAERWGIVNRVVPAEELIPTAVDLAQRMRKARPVLLRKTKDFVYQPQGLCIDDRPTKHRTARCSVSEKNGTRMRV
jgi:enoyl-CoA hydratase/carnithine racemase